MDLLDEAIQNIEDCLDVCPPAEEKGLQGTLDKLNRHQEGTLHDQVNQLRGLLIGQGNQLVHQGKQLVHLVGNP